MPNVRAPKLEILELKVQGVSSQLLDFLLSCLTFFYNTGAITTYDNKISFHLHVFRTISLSSFCPIRTPPWPMLCVA